MRDSIQQNGHTLYDLEQKVEKAKNNEKECINYVHRIERELTIANCYINEVTQNQLNWNKKLARKQNHSKCIKDHFTNSSSQLSEILEDLEEEIRDLSDKIILASQELKKQEEKVKELTQELKEKNQELERYKKELIELQIKLEFHNKELHAKIDSLNSIINQKQSDSHAISAASVPQLAWYTEYDQNMKKLKKEIKNKQDLLESLDVEDVAPLKNEIRSLKKELINLQTKSISMHQNESIEESKHVITASWYKEPLVGATLLHLACFHGWYEVVEGVLPSYPKLLCEACHGGLTPLHLACAQGCENIVRCLLAYPAQVQNLNHLSDDGRTALHLACQQNHSSIVSMLLATDRMDPLCIDSYSKTPMHYVRNPSILNTLQSYCGNTESYVKVFILGARWQESSHLPLPASCGIYPLGVLKHHRTVMYTIPKCVDNQGYTSAGVSPLRLNTPCLFVLEKGVQDNPPKLNYWLNLISSIVIGRTFGIVVPISGEMAVQQEEISMIKYGILKRFEGYKGFESITLLPIENSTVLENIEHLAEQIALLFQPLTAQSLPINPYCYVLHNFLTKQARSSTVVMSGRQLMAELSVALPNFHQNESLVHLLLSVLSEKGLVCVVKNSMDEDIVILQPTRVLDDWLSQAFGGESPKATTSSIIHKSSITSSQYLDHDCLLQVLCLFQFCHPLQQMLSVQHMKDFYFFPCCLPHYEHYEGDKSLEVKPSALVAKWFLECSNKEDFFSSILIHTMFLDLAHLCDMGPQCNLIGQLDSCKLWANRIEWQCNSESNAVVEVDDIKQTIVVTLSSEGTDKLKHVKLRDSIIHVILVHHRNLCPDIPVVESLYGQADVSLCKSLQSAYSDSVEMGDLVRAILSHSNYVKNRSGAQCHTSDIVIYDSYTGLSPPLISQLVDANLSHQTLSRQFLNLLSNRIAACQDLNLFAESVLEIPSEQVGRVLAEKKNLVKCCDSLLTLWLEKKGTYGELREQMDSFSICVGTNILY